VNRLDADEKKRILLTPTNAMYDRVMETSGKQVIAKY